MITNAFLYGVYGLVWIIISPFLLLTDVGENSDIASAMNTAGLYLSPVDAVVPVLTLLSILSVFILYEVSYIFYKITMWIIRRLPTQS